MGFVFSADFFANEINGGAELNDQEVISCLRESGRDITAVHSEELTPAYIEENKNSKFIVSNFIKLSEESKACLADCKYAIYEHDHKYLKARNPGQWKDFVAPKEEVVNSDFYKKATAVFCQSSFHSDIIKKNLNLNNVVSLGGNLWPDPVLDLLENLSERDKHKRCSIMESAIPSKNTGAAIKYCKAKSLEYQLVKSMNYVEFLTELATNDTLVFFPSTPETLSRIVVEARMAGMRVITNSLIGATHEDWFNLKGKPLIDRMRAKRAEITNKVIGEFE